MVINLKQWVRILLGLALVTQLGACATCDPNRRAKAGTAIGTVAGGVTGSVLLGNPLLFAAAEGYAGFVIGRELDIERAKQGPCIEEEIKEADTLMAGIETDQNELEGLSVEELADSLLSEIELEAEQEPLDLGGEEPAGEGAELPELDAPALSDADLDALLEGDTPIPGEDAMTDGATVYRVVFEEGSADITDRFVDLLTRVRQRLERVEGGKVVITGLGPSAPQGVDLQLYEDRQQSIEVFLQDEGVPADRIEIQPSEVEVTGRLDPEAAREIEIRIEAQ